MTATASLAHAPASRVLRDLLPIMLVVLAAYLVVGIAMPVLPLYVSHELGFGTVVVGISVSSAFAAALFSRFWAGRYADTRGTKRSMVIGLIMGMGSGLFYLASLVLVSTPHAAVTVLFLGRALLGGAESFIITGALGWGLALAGPQNTGKVIAWVGTALWAAFAVGAPAGTALYTRYGFAAIALTTALLPLVALLLVSRLTAPRPAKRATSARKALRQVLGAVLWPGVSLALTAAGFASITTFGSLLFVDHGWNSAWLMFTALSVTFMVGRMALGHLPDRLGGARVAVVSIIVEALGLAIIWHAPSPGLVHVGAAVTGLGYALVYPALGIEVVHRASSENYGLAVGAFTSFFDLAMGIAGPALGLVAHYFGFGVVFLVSSLVVLLAAGVAAGLLRQAGSGHVAAQVQTQS